MWKSYSRRKIIIWLCTLTDLLAPFILLFRFTIQQLHSNQSCFQGWVKCFQCEISNLPTAQYLLSTKQKTDKVRDYLMNTVNHQVKVIVFCSRADREKSRTNRRVIIGLAFITCTQTGLKLIFLCVRCLNKQLIANTIIKTFYNLYNKYALRLLCCPQVVKRCSFKLTY